MFHVPPQVLMLLALNMHPLTTENFSLGIEKKLWNVSNVDAVDCVHMELIKAF